MYYILNPCVTKIFKIWFHCILRILAFVDCFMVNQWLWCCCYRPSEDCWFPSFKMNLKTAPEMLKVSLHLCALCHTIRSSSFHSLFTHCLSSPLIPVYDKHDNPLTSEEEEQRAIAKSKMLGNIKFIGELGKLDLIHESILHRCIKTVRAQFFLLFEVHTLFFPFVIHVSFERLHKAAQVGI